MGATPDLFSSSSGITDTPPTHEGDANMAIGAESELASSDLDIVKVLIVTALPIEHAAVLASLESYKRIGIKNDPKVYEIGYFRSPDIKKPLRAVIVCQSGMGNDNAATAATDALRSFQNIEHIILSGIAGGCPDPTNYREHVRLGDIVFSGEAGIIEYDFIKQETERQHIRSSAQKPSGRILNVADAICADQLLGQRPWLEEINKIVAKMPDFARPPEETDVLYNTNRVQIQHPLGSERNGRPAIHKGGIATADILQKDPTKRDELRERYRVKAIEMEAGGMQNAAWARGKDIMVVRGICDYCDSFKNDEWQNYAAAASAAFTKILILGMPDEWFP